MFKIIDHINQVFIFMIQLEDKNWYDVAIVGAGPGGATCAYFLGKYPLGVSGPQRVDRAALV